MEVVRVHKVKISPSLNQKETFDFWFRRCKYLYNAALEERIAYYKATGKTLSVYEQKKELVGIKEWDKTWKDVPNKILADTLFVLDEAYKSFFRGNGFPKFKREINTVEFVKTDIRLIKGKLYVPKIKESIKYSEEIKPNYTSVKLTYDGHHYYLAFTYKENQVINLENPDHTDLDNILGVDLGLKDTYTDSNNYGSGRFSLKLIKKYVKRVAKLNKSLSSKKKGSIKFKKIKKNLGKTHRRLSNTRKDYLEKTANNLLSNKESFIVIGDIQVQNIVDTATMTQEYKYKHKGRIKSFYNTGLTKFKEIVKRKAHKYNKVVIFVSERNTSKTCSCCGNVRHDLTLNDRVYKCYNTNCKYNKNSIGRDYNSAINMKLLGSSKLGTKTPNFVLQKRIIQNV